MSSFLFTCEFKMVGKCQISFKCYFDDLSFIDLYLFIFVIEY